MDVLTVNILINCYIIFWITYWIVGSIITYQMHKNNIRPVTNLLEVISNLMINMMWTFIGLILLFFCPLRAMTDSHIGVKIILSYLLTEIWFYHFHLLIHHPHLYTKIHKIHHRFRSPFSLAALYCTPYEVIFLNLFSVSLGPIIFQIPDPIIYVWYFLVSLNVLVTHSGIHIPYIITDEHDTHHRVYNKNYGLSIYLDWIYGTYYIDNRENNNTEDIDNPNIDTEDKNVVKDADKDKSTPSE